MKIGTMELVVIFIVALLVLGPEKVPKYAKKAGKMMSSVKNYADKLSEEINESVVEPMEEIQKPLKKAVEPLNNISKDINKPIKDIKKSVSDIGKPKKKEEDITSGADVEEKNTTEAAAKVQEILSSENTTEVIAEDRESASSESEA